MPFDVNDFIDPLTQAITSWNNHYGLNPPDSATPDLTAVKIFDTFSATAGSANLSVAYASKHWLHDPAHGVQMFGGDNIRLAALWDTFYGGSTASFGNGVAISARHVLVSLSCLRRNWNFPLRALA
jgi:hypothetical protein